jgi:hypothetical protein
VSAGGAVRWIGTRGDEANADERDSTASYHRYIRQYEKSPSRPLLPSVIPWTRAGRPAFHVGQHGRLGGHRGAGGAETGAALSALGRPIGPAAQYVSAFYPQVGERLGQGQQRRGHSGLPGGGSPTAAATSERTRSQRLGVRLPDQPHADRHAVRRHELPLLRGVGP